MVAANKSRGPLIVAASKGFVEVVQLLLEHGANIDAVEPVSA